MSATLRCVLVTDVDLTRAVLFPRPRASRAVMVRIFKRKFRGAFWCILALALGILVVFLSLAIPDWGLFNGC